MHSQISTSCIHLEVALLSGVWDVMVVVFVIRAVVDIVDVHGDLVVTARHLVLIST